MTRFRPLVLMLLAAMLVGVGPCNDPTFEILSPPEGALTLASSVPLEIRVPTWINVPNITVSIDGGVVPVALTRTGLFVTGTLTGAFAGVHEVEVTFMDDGSMQRRTASFEGIALNSPDDCEVLNDAECMLPFPSSRYLREDETTGTGLRIDFPSQAMPHLKVGSLTGFIAGSRSRLDPAPYNRNDGFSPTVQVLMHFPGGVDLVASDVARINPQTGNFDLRSLDWDSPTVLVDAETGEHLAHFVENDDRGSGDRITTILRPGKSLLPGRRYLVGVRNLVHPGGAPVLAESVFAALRDGRPTTIAAVEDRRAAQQEVLWGLEDHGVPPEDLVLAFEFWTQSDEALTSEMLAMRDIAFEFVDSVPAAALITPPLVLEFVPADQCTPGAVWRAMLGSYLVPNFLTSQPNSATLPPADPVGDPDTLGYLAHDSNGDVLLTGNYLARFGFSIPCNAVLDGPVAPVVFGHGLFGNGPSQTGELGNSLLPYIEQLKQQGLISADLDFDYGVVGTHWSGMSSLDLKPLPSNVDFSNLSPADLAALVNFASSFIGQLFVDFDTFQAMPDRLRQGQLATLVLARLLDNGAFNSLPAFQTPPGSPVGAGQPVLRSGEVSYFGASLGGIMGLMFTSLYPQLEHSIVDVGAINFSFLLQRAKPFKAFQSVLEVIDPDPVRQLIGLGLLHELWVKGESAGYINHLEGEITPRFPGNGINPVLMTVARHDQQVSTLGAQIAAASIGLMNLPGSAEQNLPLVPDALYPGARSGHIIYDTGAYQVGTQTEPFIPPTVNRPAPVDDNTCDPHATRFTIPASIEQMLTFFQPEGRIHNFCNGLCDAAEPLELPGGLATPCVP